MTTSMFRVSPRQAFVVAAPRSGTTWLSQLLNAHPRVLCTERRLFGHYADMVFDEDNEVPRLRVTLDKYVDAVLLHDGLGEAARVPLTRALIGAIQRVEKRSRKVDVVVDKVTPYVGTADVVLEGIGQYLPRARVIRLVRDGRDVCVSGVFHWFNKRKADHAPSARDDARLQAFRSGRGDTLERFFSDEEVEEWAQTWADPIRALGRKHAETDVYTVRYEEMLADTERALCGVLTFLGVRATRAILASCLEAGDFQRMSGGRARGESQPGAHVRKGVAGDWQKFFRRRDAEIFDAVAGDLLVELGYASGRGWVDEQFS